MATNYQDKFDPAIKRAGRFDLLLCMGPPTFEEKVAHLDRFYSDSGLDNGQAEIARRALRDFVGNDIALRDQLALFTYAEFRGFLNRIDEAGKLGDALQTLGPTGFKSLVVQHTDYAMLKLHDLPEGVVRAICDWTDIPPSKRSGALSHEIGRYLRDRSDSRRQY